MNLTIPIRAQNSTGSRSRQLRGSSSTKNIKAHRKRYIFSIITAALLIGTLTVGSMGGMSQAVSALGDPSSPPSSTSPSPSSSTSPSPTSPNPNNNPDGSPTNPHQNPPTNQDNTPPSGIKSMTPAATTTPSPPAPQTASASPLMIEKTVPLVEQPTVPESVDTAPAIANMAAAQANVDTQSVNYASNRLPDDIRDRILMYAGITTLVGILLYAISFIGSATPKTSKREIPIRYIVPVRKVVTH